MNVLHSGCGPLYKGDYMLQTGDTMWDVAITCGAPLECLSVSNPDIADLSVIFSGQHIKIPAACRLAAGSSPNPAGTYCQF